MQSSRSGPPPSSAGEDVLADYLRRLCSDVTLVANKDGFFPRWVDQISTYISEDFVAKFAKLSTDYDRISMVWTVKPVHSLTIGKFYKAKDGGASVRLREEGNAAFQKRTVRLALERYCQAVTRAPNSGTSLPLSYGNRSAALSYLKEYRWSIRDIRLALVAKYPADLHYKLLERAGHCYQELGLLQEGWCCYRGALAALPTAGLEEAKMSTWSKNLHKKMEECAQSKVSDCRKSVVTSTSEEEQRICSSEPCDADLEKAISLIINDPENMANSDWKGVGEPTPGVSLPSNPFLPSASSALRLHSSPQAGRYAVADRRVEAGEVLVEEDPFAAVVARDMMGAYCSYCFRRLLAAVPCPDCCGVAYCTEVCRQSGLPAHRWECPFLDLLHASGMSLNGYLALRVISSKPLQYFLQLRPALQQTGLLQCPANSSNEAAQQPQELFVPSLEHPHDSSSYLSVYRMVGLEKQREPLDFLQRTLMAVLLLKVLQRSGYFGAWNEETAADAAADDEQLYIGALLLRNLQVLQFNAHEVSGMTFLSEPLAFRSSKSLYLGLAVYPTVAFFNHSCFPAVSRYFIGRRMVVCSIRSVEEGGILAENYGPVFTHHTYEQRQRKLLSRYWFNCECEACVGRWGTYPELVQPMRLKCPHCNEPLSSLPNPSTRKPLGAKEARCSMCHKEVPFEQMTSDMALAQQRYVSGKREMDAGAREAAVSDLLQYVTLAQRHAALPLKDVHLALEALRLLVAARGTCALVLKKK
ncbi:SET domain [Trinorchestia longiramus]|nr:SET domain [Trinorchestia longiramus]